MAKFGVIYLLTNSANGKQYVGQSIDVSRRMKEHRKSSELAIDKAIDKYGYENFTLTILEDEISKSKINMKERKYIKKHNTFKGKGYNCTYGGEMHIFSEEHKKRMSENHADIKGEKNPFYGKEHSEEAKQKNREAHRGTKNSNTKLTRKR